MSLRATTVGWWVMSLMFLFTCWVRAIIQLITRQWHDDGERRLPGDSWSHLKYLEVELRYNALS